MFSYYHYVLVKNFWRSFSFFISHDPNEDFVFTVFNIGENGCWSVFGVDIQNPNTKVIADVKIPAFLEIPDANLTVHGS